MNFKTIEWRDDSEAVPASGGKVFMLDQRKLPVEEVAVECSDYKQVSDAIKTMVIRGAPAIGVAAAMGVALGALGIDAKTYASFREKLIRVCETLLASRPTAVNLRWAIERMTQVLDQSSTLSIPQLKERLKNEALLICEEDIAINRRMGDWGESLIQSGQTVLTHCNAGALATAGWGTALGVIYSAKAKGKSCLGI